MPDEDPTARVGALFDALADTYDSVGVDFFQPIAAGLREALTPRVGERWLDIGVGRGAVTLPVAAAVGPAGRVDGIDISERMVELTRAEAATRGLGNVHVAVGDAMAPQFAPESFNAVSSCLVLFFLADPAQALSAWLPLLAPGGRVGVTTFGPTDERMQAIDSAFRPYLPPTMRDARTNGMQGPFASDAGMEEMLRSAGFSDVRTVAHSIPVRFADAEAWYRFTWSTGQRQFWMSVPEEKHPEVRAVAFDLLATYAAEDGSITFTQGVRHTLGVRPVA